MNSVRPIVVIESPYAGDIVRNTLYAQFCLRDSILNFGEAPFASHILYPGALVEDDPAQRMIGIETGFVFHRVASILAVYDDLGISRGMRRGILNAEKINLKIEMRKLSMTDFIIFEKQCKELRH